MYQSNMFRKGGTGGGGCKCHLLGDRAWQQLQLAVKRPWSVGSFQSGGALSGWRALTIERLLMSGCGQVHGLATNI